jgi:hypothetical protein
LQFVKKASQFVDIVWIFGLGEGYSIIEKAIANANETDRGNDL